MKKVTSYNLKKKNTQALSERSLLSGESSVSLYLDKLMDIYLSENGFLVELSDESANLLKGLIDKHERTAGWLLDRMIKKYCSNSAEENKGVVTTTEKPVKKSKAFKPPTVEEVWQYCNERCNNVDAQEFVDHYTANNWFRGKTKIKDWKACVRTWEKNSKPKHHGNNEYSKTTAKNIDTLGEWVNE